MTKRDIGATWQTPIGFLEWNGNKNANSAKCARFLFQALFSSRHLQMSDCDLDLTTGVNSEVQRASRLDQTVDWND